MPRSVSGMAPILSRARAPVQRCGRQTGAPRLVRATIARDPEMSEGGGMGALLSLFPPGSAVDADGMLTLAGCRADDLAAEFGTPVLVVCEPSLRARAREYADGLAARWPRSRVVF